MNHHFYEIKPSRTQAGAAQHKQGNPTNTVGPPGVANNVDSKPSRRGVTTGTIQSVGLRGVSMELIVQARKTTTNQKRHRMLGLGPQRTLSPPLPRIFDTGVGSR